MNAGFAPTTVNMRSREETTITTEAATSRPPRRRHQEILEAAARVFHEKGYESTSIQDIADEVGILKGSLYYYIRSKEDLLYEIIRDIHEDAIANVSHIDSLGGTALEKIRAFVLAHMTFTAENLVKITVFFHDFRSLNEERQRAIIASRDLYERRLRALIDEGKREGSIRRDVDAKVAALAAMGAMNWTYQWYKPRGRKSIREIANGFADLIVNGLAAAP
jgi:TetR/AcrR family transcriptional regulator, cholesterol catabolism regulator